MVVLSLARGALSPNSGGQNLELNFTLKGECKMGEIARGSDGRRLFTPEFKKVQIGRVLRGEITHSELCRELDIKSSVVSKWRRLVEQGSQVAVSANEDVVPASQLREAQGRIRELERALGRKTMEVEILQMAQEEVKKRPAYYGVSVRK